MPREDSRKEMPQTPDSIDQGGGVYGIMDFERPIGRKAEKANRKRKDDGKDIATEYLKNKKKILEESCVAEKKKVRIKAENVRLQELKENERIMMLDTSSMNEDQRTFYDGLKKGNPCKTKIQVIRWVEMMLVMSCFNLFLVVTNFRP